MSSYSVFQHFATDKAYGLLLFSFFFSSRRRHTRSTRDWSSDVCSSDLRHFADTRIDPLQIAAAVPVDAVEMDVARVDARTRLAVVPPVFAGAGFRTRRRAEPIRVARDKFSAVNRRMMQKIVVPSRRVRRGLETDDAAELVRAVGREL